MLINTQGWFQAARASHEALSNTIVKVAWIDGFVAAILCQKNHSFRGASHVCVCVCIFNRLSLQ